MITKFLARFGKKKIEEEEKQQKEEVVHDQHCHCTSRRPRDHASNSILDRVPRMRILFQSWRVIFLCHDPLALGLSLS